MPTYGRYAPQPERYGGGAGKTLPILEKICESLGTQLGTAYDVSASSNVHAYIQAYARAINHAWSTNKRLGNQWDPARVTDFLPRWEKIFGIYPSQADTESLRRARLARAFENVAKSPTAQAIYDEVKFELNSFGNVFLDIIHTNTSTPAVSWTPYQTSLAFNNWPIQKYANLQGNPNQPSWSSNIAHLLVKVQQPGSMTDAEFYREVAKMHNVLDRMLPAWCTWDFARYAHAGNVAGFYLDGDPVGPAGTLVNLDNQPFAWTPDSEAGLTGWWDARELTPGSTVTTWTNKKNGSLNLTASGAPQAYPGSVFFDGVDDYFTGAAISNFVTGTEFTAFFVFQPNTVSTDSATIPNNDTVFCDANQKIGVSLRSSGTVNYYYDDGSIQTLNSTPSNLQGMHYGYFRQDTSAGGTIYRSLNGESEVSAASSTGATLTGALHVGHNNLGGGNAGFLNGYISTLLIYNTALSTAARDRVTAWLRSEFFNY